MDYLLFAESFRYPISGRLETFELGLQTFSGETRRDYAAFVKGIQKLTLAEWEELYTLTWDLNPLAAPYLGYQIWGENYQRGNFMALINNALLAVGVETDGELPDHLIPILRYLAVSPDPLAELCEILPVALEKILAALRKADPANPYIHLMESLVTAQKEQSRKGKHT
jgi:nitrate reductase molybdenum cofactor assembly chaperone NarJ/NarW